MDRSERATYRNKRNTRARERYEARKRRHGEPPTHAVRPSADEPPAATRQDRAPRRLSQVSLAGVRDLDWGAFFTVIRQGISDGWWYLRRNPMVWRGGAAAIALMIAVYVISTAFSGNVPRGVDVAGIAPIGGLSVAQASERLMTTWRDDIEIELIIDRENSITVRPQDLGIRLDATATAQAAKDLGLGALPLRQDHRAYRGGGTSSPPQSYLLTIADEVNTRPMNARYQLVDGQVVGVPGQAGRRLDTTSTLDYLTQNLSVIMERGRFELLMTPLQADFNDPTPHLEAAQALAERPFELRGYDPVSNQSFTWPIQPQTAITWVQAGPGSLVLDSVVFTPYVDRLNDTLNQQDGGDRRYLDPETTSRKISDAIQSGATYADLRVRHQPYTHTVVRGDSGFGVARRTGLPFYLLERANTNRDLNVLSVGDVLNVPSPDEVMPADPVPHKRIIVDLTLQYLTAFENGQVIYEWPISSGVRNAPTSPGVFQILSHSEKAYGSSNTLCDAAGLVCGRWEMNWFMGIYEVIPGLENGFHGSVLLPNGGLLGDGVVGSPVTFGCVMSTDDQARMLYEWRRSAQP